MQRYAHTPARLSPYFNSGNLTASREIGERPFPFSDGCDVDGCATKEEIEMKKLIVVTGIVSLAGIALFFGCSKEGRDEAMNRLGKAGKALNGEVRPDDMEHATPNIVAEQQRKERIRQNTQWTAENQALHPIEYCQAQLEDLAQVSQQLEVQAHKYAVAKSQVQRSIANADSQVSNFEKFIAEGKKAYREAESTGKWPTSVNGYSMTQDKLKEKLVEASRRIKPLKDSAAKNKTLLKSLERKSELVAARQREAVELKERLTITIGDLKLKKIDEGSDGLKDTLNALNDSLASLGGDLSDPSLDDLASPDSKSSMQTEFDALMAE